MTMGWKSVHRWLGLALGTLAMVLGLSGALLAFDPVQQAWQAPGDADTLPVAALVQRVQRVRMQGVRRQMRAKRRLRENASGSKSSACSGSGSSEHRLQQAGHCHRCQRRDESKHRLHAESGGRWQRLLLRQWLRRRCAW